MCYFLAVKAYFHPILGSSSYQNRVKIYNTHALFVEQNNRRCKSSQAESEKKLKINCFLIYGIMSFFKKYKIPTHQIVLTFFKKLT